MKIKIVQILLVGSVFLAGCQAQFGDGYYLDTDLAVDTASANDLPTDPPSDTESGLQTDTPAETESDLPTDVDKETDPGTGTECDIDLEFCNMVSDPDYSYDICMNGWCVSPGTCGDSVTCNAVGVYYSIPPADVATSQYDTTKGDEPVIVDSVTELIWQGCPAGQRGSICSVKEDDVSEALPAKKFSWADALEYCDTLVWRGLDAWHLPSEYELLTIVDHGFNNPAIDLMAFPGTETLAFWTSSVCASDPEDRWLVDFAYGDLVHIPSQISAYARCVLRGPALLPDSPLRSENVSGQPVVDDVATGLIWQGCPAPSSGSDCSLGTPQEYPWQEALDYCEALVWGGDDDWYLPDVKALQSVADNRMLTFAMNSVLFPKVGGEGEYWSSTSQSQKPSAAWFVNFGDYQVSLSAKTDSHRVRCNRKSLR